MVLLYEPYLLIFEVLKLSLVVEFATIHDLKHRVLCAVHENNLLVVMGNHQLEFWAQVVQVVESHHASQLLVMVLGSVGLTEFELLIEVKNNDLLHTIPLAGHVTVVGVVALSVGGYHVAMGDRVVDPLIDLNYLSYFGFHVHDEYLGASPANNEFLPHVELYFFDEGNI